MEISFSGIHFYRPGTVIKVRGDDAANFLQGQFTNDLRQAEGGATYGLWLSQKGKVIADSYVLRHANHEFTLVGINSVASVILQRLEQYIIADDVLLDDVTGKSWGFTLWGGHWVGLLKAVLGSLPVQRQFLQKDEVLVFAGKRTTSENYEVIGSENTIKEWGERLIAQGCPQLGVELAEVARISSGIPAVPQDIGAADLPNEAGLEHTAISFTKGCYLGQEVMARLRNLGQVRRQLRGVRGEGAAPKSGTPLFQLNKKVGEIRSAVSTGEQFIALAMLTRMGLDENTGFTFAATNQPAKPITIWMS